MDECIVCCEKALYICKPCKGSFCEEHKGLHEKSKNRVHIFKEIGVKLDSRQTENIVENLILKINKVKEFKERITLETEMLIRKIKELCTNCLNNAEGKLQYYMNLLQIIQNPITTEEVSMIEDQLKVSLSINIPAQNFKDILNFEILNSFGSLKLVLKDLRK